MLPLISKVKTTLSGCCSKLAMSTVWRTPLSRISKSAARSPRTGFPFSVTSTSTRTASTLDEKVGFCCCADSTAAAETNAAKIAGSRLITRLPRGEGRG